MPEKERIHYLHNLGEPGTPKQFTSWNSLLREVVDTKVTGYAVDSNGDVVNFRKGKRPGVNKGTWVKATQGICE